MKLYSLKEGLKRARKEAGLTQAELTEILKSKGIASHIKTVMNWEQGIAEPSLGTLMKLTELYNCDLDYLTGRIDCKTHDLQFIHDQTGLSEKAIEKLLSLVTEPDWDQMERDLRESAPEIPEEKIHDSIQRQRESWETSPARDYSQILSLILEDLNSEYLLSLITKRVKGYQPRSRSDRPLTHKELTQDDLWIDLDGQRVLTHKRNMLESLIQSEVASMIPVITEAYHSSKSEG